jgi:hypothetical protein
VEHKFQWSAFSDASKTEQYVVRCDEIQDLVDSIALVKAAIQEQREAEHAPDVTDESNHQPTPEPEQEVHMCAIHNRPMKLRKTKDGSKTWFDHRWQDKDNAWHLCNGKKVTIQEPSNSAPVS